MFGIKLRIVLFILIALPATAFAQIVKYGPARQAAEKAPALKNARRNPENPLVLPFWDDFSVTDGNLANPLNWIVNDKVFVNDGQAINPPSFNVATFDGYNENGLPYSTDPLATGVGDTLESQPINLALVPPADRSMIYLSFTYQPGGNSEMPDPDDYLQLEFKRDNGGWIVIDKYRVTGSTEPDKFYDVVVQIPSTTNPNYFHSTFQFRFTSLGRSSGAYDAWHLDYVYLNRRVLDNQETIPPNTNTGNINEYDINTNISDRTITRPFTSILPNGYFAMPNNHFKPTELLTPRVSLYSLKHVTFAFQYTTYISDYKITTYTDGVPTVTYDDSPDPAGDATDFIPADGIPILQHVTRDTQNLPPLSNFDSDADSTKVKVKITINGGDNDKLRDYYDRYEDINFRLNDSLTHTFTLSNYYAYDDGVAEYSAGLAAQGNQLAYRFIMDSDLGARTLNGIYVYLPYTASTVPQNMRIYVFPDKNGKPDSLWSYSQFVPVTRSSNNLFTLIPFAQEVIVRDTFYIGYMETVTDRPDRIRIGLDASHDTGEHLYYRNTVYHQWIQNDVLQGSLMIRPRFGTTIPITGVEDPVNPVSVYPNPNRGEFYLEGRADNIQICTITGQAVGFTIEDGSERKKITLRNTASGLYIVRYRSGTKVFSTKIVVTGY